MYKLLFFINFGKFSDVFSLNMSFFTPSFYFSSSYSIHLALSAFNNNSHFSGIVSVIVHFNSRISICLYIIISISLLIICLKRYIHHTFLQFLIHSFLLFSSSLRMRQKDRETETETDRESSRSLY